MAVYNTTYNFNSNQGNMNFGKALMYGAFGSLTGMMGGCGLGNMYGSPASFFGMGGSLFSMCGCSGLGNMYGSPASFFGMGGYGCGCTTDNSYVGSLIGMIGSNLLIGGIAQAIQNKKSKVSASDEIKNVKADAKEHLKTLSLNSLDEFKNVSEIKANALKSVTDDYYKAKASVSGCEKRLEPLLKKLKDKYKDDRTLTEKDFQIEDPKDNTKKVTDTVEYEAYKQLIKDIIAEEKALESAKEILEKKETAKNNRETEVDAAIKALEPLKEDYDDLKEKERQEQVKDDGKDLKKSLATAAKDDKISKNQDAVSKLNNFKSLENKLRKHQNDKALQDQVVKAYKEMAGDEAISKNYPSLIESAKNFCKKAGLNID